VIQIFRVFGDSWFSTINVFFQDLVCELFVNCFTIVMAFGEPLSMVADLKDPSFNSYGFQRAVSQWL